MRADVVDREDAVLQPYPAMARSPIPPRQPACPPTDPPHRRLDHVAMYAQTSTTMYSSSTETGKVSATKGPLASASPGSWLMKQLPVDRKPGRFWRGCCPGRNSSGPVCADVELPAMPGALQHLLRTGIVVLPRLLRPHQPDQPAGAEAAARMRAAVGQREEYSPATWKMAICRPFTSTSLLPFSGMSPTEANDMAAHPLVSLIRA